MILSACINLTYTATTPDPRRISVALDSEIKKVLTRGIRRLDEPNERYASFLCIQDIIRSILFDSGANGSLNHRDVESYLIDSVKSAVYNVITVADGGGMKGYVDGKLKCMVVNTANHKGFPEQTPMEFSIRTTSGLAMELLSFDEFYRDGWGVHLRPPDIEGGVCEMYRPKRNNIAAANVPLRYDWDGSGGFYLEYILKIGSRLNIKVYWQQLFRIISLQLAHSGDLR